jgi:hypothetical protein
MQGPVRNRGQPRAERPSSLPKNSPFSKEYLSLTSLFGTPGTETTQNVSSQNSTPSVTTTVSSLQMTDSKHASHAHTPYTYKLKTKKKFQPPATRQVISLILVINQLNAQIIVL